MTCRSCIVLGSTGLVGSAVRDALEAGGIQVIGVHSRNYAEHVGRAADALVNCNGNTFRFKAAADPAWDFDASVSTVARSLFDFRTPLYVYVSTIDVYNDRGDSARTSEDTAIDSRLLEPYAFHKWLAERLVERHATRSAILRCATVVGTKMKKGPLFDVLQRRPIHMTPESTLALVDTATIALAVRAVLDGRLSDAIVNVSGTGSVSVGDLGRLARVPLQVAADEVGRTYRYDINNERLRAVLPIGSSTAMAERCIADWMAMSA